MGVHAVDEGEGSLWGERNRRGERVGDTLSPPPGWPWLCPPPPRAHHAGFGGEDNDLVEGGELLEEALDAWALLEAPAGDELVLGGGKRDEEVSQGGWQQWGGHGKPRGTLTDHSGCSRTSVSSMTRV